MRGCSNFGVFRFKMLLCKCPDVDFWGHSVPLRSELNIFARYFALLSLLRRLHSQSLERSSDMFSLSAFVFTVLCSITCVPRQCLKKRAQLKPPPVGWWGYLPPPTGYVPYEARQEHIVGTNGSHYGPLCGSLHLDWDVPHVFQNKILLMSNIVLILNSCI